VLIVALAGLVLFGCEARDDSELRLLMRDDPGYRDLVEMKEQMADQIKTMRDQLDGRKKELQANPELINFEEGDEALFRQSEVEAPAAEK